MWCCYCMEVAGDSSSELILVKGGSVDGTSSTTGYGVLILVTLQDTNSFALWMSGSLVKHKYIYKDIYSEWMNIDTRGRNKVESRKIVWWVPDFGGQSFDMDPNFYQYWHFAVPLSAYVLIETHTKVVTPTSSVKSMVDRLGYI